MKIQYILYFVVYAMVILFVRSKKMSANGTQQRHMANVGSSRQRERTTFNTTQSASAPISQMQQRSSGSGFPIPILLNNSFGMGRENDDFITSERRKYGRKDFIGRGEHRDVDCQLDERIFGSKYQNKDLF